MASLYREIFIWKRLGANRGVRYCCFENLETKRFHVQSADFFNLPVTDELVKQHQRQQIELFTEVEPAERVEGYASITDAIEAHDRDFT
jgi:hypothetical protein